MRNYRAAPRSGRTVRGDDGRHDVAASHRTRDPCARHHDVYFNMWRLAWVAHALTTAPATSSTATSSIPSRARCTFSDAMIVEGPRTPPLMWAGAAGARPQPAAARRHCHIRAGIFVPGGQLTGSAGAGLTAGVVFAFAPYRFEHYMHMELQWTIWIPWAFWALHRTFETGEWRTGLLVGVFMRCSSCRASTTAVPRDAARRCRVVLL